MVLSCGAAFLLPFEVFLLSYAVLGPLHYLTQISWLHERRYFMAQRRDALILVVLTLVVFAGSQQALGDYRLSFFSGWDAHLLLFTFLTALLLVAVRSTVWRLVGAALLAGGLVAVREMPAPLFLFLVFLPTVVHVFVFTGAFILLGSLKQRSASGYLSLVVFAACATSFFVYRPDSSTYAVGLQTMEQYRPFAFQNGELAKVLGLQVFDYRETFVAEASIVVMRFIAFAYTYHYLNWFSKTSIIGWHKVSWRRLGVVASLWLVALGLYWRDFGLGLRALFLLSILHVILEFPLNHRSFREIGLELSWRIGLAPAPTK
jgi:hypothetical protein